MSESTNPFRDVEGEFLLLGTGTSVGVPAIGCPCEVCQSTNPKNNRTRCGAVLGLPEGNLLIDTPTELRVQLLREKISIIHATIYTHAHADHLFGLDDVRLFPLYLNAPMPIYCEPVVEDRIRKSYDYAFSTAKETHSGSRPQLEIRSITEEPFEILGAKIIPIRLRHGHFDVLGFRVGNVAYCTDTNEIPQESWPLLADLDVLILDSLRRRPHVTHFSLQEAIEVAERVRPKRTFFTHLSHELEHDATNASLPAGMELAYDGLRIPLT